MRWSSAFVSVTPPCSSMLARMRSSNATSLRASRAIPITGTSSRPWRAIPYNAGIVILYPRSPVAPNQHNASARPTGLCLLVMTTELLAHRGQQAVGELGVVAGLEAVEHCGRQHVDGHAGVHGGADRPPSLARVRDPTFETLERARLRQRVGRQVEEPRCDHAAAPPHLGDLGDVE